MSIIPAHLLRPSAPQPAPKRYVVCKRKLQKTPPGATPVQYEPEIIGGYWNEAEAVDMAAVVLSVMREKKFTVTRDQTVPIYRWDVFKINNKTGEWQDYEVYIEVISF